MTKSSLQRKFANNNNDLSTLCKENTNLDSYCYECDGSVKVNRSHYMEIEIELYSSMKTTERRESLKFGNSSTKSKRRSSSSSSSPSSTSFSLLKMNLWSRCFIVLFLHIGCLAVDHRHRNSELPYEEDEVRLILGQSLASTKLLDDENDISESVESFGNDILAFHPVSLDFKESPVGMPRLGVVRVDNRLLEETLKLISISGSTAHFHSSFFADKVISPGSNTTFEIVFLSRSEGHVESNLYIHTSKGLFKYHVQGIGLPNPYRLKPLVGARIPVNGSYEPLITMHNPHGRRIQVVEMLSSGSDFHLSLPDSPEGGEEEGAWAIEPFQTKPVMKGTFQGKAEGNHTGYIKIRVNSTTSASEYLLVPVEVQVSSYPGIYSSQESLDFGLLVKSDKAKTLSLSLINAQQLPINIQSVSVKGHPNNAVKIEFRPVSIEADSAVSTVVALVTFDPSEAHSPKDSHGFLEILSDSGDSITVPFRATLLIGELAYNSSSLGFFIKTDNFPPRNFSIRNNFPTTVAIYQLSMSHPDIIHLTNFKGNGSHIIPQGEKVDLVRIKVRKRQDLCNPATDVHILLKSNVTNLKLPIRCYDGKLEAHMLEGKIIKFGRVELLSSHVEYFSVGNLNPVEIRLKSWGSNASWAHVDLVGMKKGVKEDLMKIQDFDNLKKSLFLQPDHLAVFSIELRRPATEGSFWGEAFITTDHNQTLRIPFSVTVSKGSIHSDPLIFEKAFPGKLSVEKLHLSSTFNSTLGLQNVIASPDGVPLWFSPQSTQDLDISPHRKTYVGKVYFDPRQFCRDECYSGFLLTSSLGLDWIRASTISWETAKLDWNILKTLQKRFEQVKEVTLANMTLWVESTTATEFKVNTMVRYGWPRITGTRVVVFPLTAMGNETYVDIPIQNPTNTPLFVHALLASEYGRNWEQYCHGNGVGGNLTEGNTVFEVVGLGSDASQSTERTVIFKEVQNGIVTEFLETAPTSGSFFLLPPLAKFYLRYQFKPVSKQLTSTLLIIRNNLTGVETTWLKGRAGTGLLTLGSGPPGSSLLFQLTEKLLHGCEKEPVNKYIPPQLTVRRSFLARNIGDIPLHIPVVEIHPPQNSYWTTFVSGVFKLGESCEGFGFRILNCGPFILEPNETHSIDIAYTPDFTVSRMIRTLRLIDSNGVYYNFSLVAMIPNGMLGVCSTIIVRPSWEPVLRYILWGIALSGFFAGSFLSYFESNSIITTAVVTAVRVVPPEQSLVQVEKEDAKGKLDLKAVYEKVDNRFKRIQQEMNPTPCPGNTVNSPSGSSETISIPQLAPASQITNPNSINNNNNNTCKVASNNPQHATQTGVRNRKGKNGACNGTIPTINAGSEPIADRQIIPGGKWKVKTGGKDRRPSIPDEQIINAPTGVSAAPPPNPDSKPYVEVKRKGKGNGFKGRGQQSQQAPHKSSQLPKSTTTSGKIESESSQLVEPVLTEWHSRHARDTTIQVPPPAIPLPKAERRYSLKHIPPTAEIVGEPKITRKDRRDNVSRKSPEISTVLTPGPNPPEVIPKQVVANTIGAALPNDLVKRVTKQKQLSGSSSSGSHASGSPIDFGPSWDAPKVNPVDALAECTFPPKIQASTSRLTSGSSGGSIWNDTTGPARFPSPPPGFSPILPHQQPAMNMFPFQSQPHPPASLAFHHQKPMQQMALQTQNHASRRPGVIGQPRQSTSVDSGMDLNMSTVINSILTTMSITPVTTSTTASRCHGQTGRVAPWNVERQRTLADDWKYGRPGDAFTTTVPYGYSKQMIPTSTSTPPLPTSGLTKDLYHPIPPTLSNEMIANLWQMNTFDSISGSSGHYPRPLPVQTSGISMVPTSTGGVSSTGYGSRMRAEGSVSYPSFTQSKWQPTSMGNTFYPNNSMQQDLHAGPSTSSPYALETSQASIGSAWPSHMPHSTASSAFDHGDWQPLTSVANGRDGRGLAHLWQNPPPNSPTAWPTSLSETNLRHREPKMTRAENSHSVSNLPIGLQNQREVEAGLGFNPFGLSIWHDVPSGDKKTGWSNIDY